MHNCRGEHRQGVQRNQNVDSVAYLQELVSQEQTILLVVNKERPLWMYAVLAKNSKPIDESCLFVLILLVLVWYD